MCSAFNVEGYRELARKRLPRMVFDYLDGGADDEKGLQRNRQAFDRLEFLPRRLVSVAERSLATQVFGKRQALPLMVAPMGLSGAFWPKGDLELARAAKQADIPFILSTAANASIEEVAYQVGGDLWFQLYVVHPTLADQLVARALSAGYRTLVLTTDVAVNGKRERDLRSGFGLPFKYSPRVVLDGMLHPCWSWRLLTGGMPQMANFASREAYDVELQAALLSRKMDASFDWNALQRLRQRWPHRLLVKGILHPEDASRCIELGADGVILSNHGGRQLDSSCSPLATLADIAQAHPGKVLVDSGFRRGSDVVKAIALGASGVLIGRPLLYGLAAAGEKGASAVLDIFQDEMNRTLANLGCASVDGLSAELVIRTT
ncbi:mandelate dehydrogenase [Pseudomonas psychrotolerans]|uniref:alpha-hydroxy-acid oxidizing protein n=1 Tax=Pseudomonas oryzihabitans TaxID=47885 RepID=UPI000586FF06|nr:alpha-hydroxy-acid oxidizing protein [Pseudomonas psychrotolerans]MBA1182073.1 mandelate dehydrogenase [Pseudomonas psychrotolerans]MBA1214329.1 mandelate dehydrogenase [Pseudomonas psychrotolerans]